MFPLILTLALALSSTTVTRAATDLPIDLTAAEQIASSPDGRAVAWTSSREGSAALVVISGRNTSKKTLTWSNHDLSDALEGSAVTALEWSPDGRYLAIELSSPDGESAVLLADCDRGGKLIPVIADGDANLVSPHWAPAGHSLLLIPAANDESAGEAGGIMRYEVESRKSSRILPNYWINAFTISGNAINALATDLVPSGPAVVDRIIHYELSTGRSETIISRRTAEEQDSPKGLQL